MIIDPDLRVIHKNVEGRILPPSQHREYFEALNSVYFFFKNVYKCEALQLFSFAIANIYLICLNLLWCLWNKGPRSGLAYIRGFLSGLRRKHFRRKMPKLKRNAIVRTARSYWDSLYDSSRTTHQDVETLTYYQRKERLYILMRYLPLSNLILEAGCGTAKDLFNLSKMSDLNRKINKKLFVGLDYSLKAIKLAKLNFPNLDFVLGDVRYLPFRSNIFDLVFNAGVIEHFTNTSIPLKEMIRTSKAYVIAFVPNTFSWWFLYRQLVNFLAKLNPKFHSWPVWEKSFNWLSLLRIGKTLSLNSIKVEGVHLMHYIYPIILIETCVTKRPLFPCSIKKMLINFLAKIDEKPSNLSKFLGMEIALIAKK